MIFRNTYNLIKASWFQFLGLTFLVSFLIFLLNLFIGFHDSISSSSQDIKDRLGIYFYIKDTNDPEKKDMIYSETIQLKETLEANNLRVTYYSKADALEVLEKRMPDLIANFNKYGIENPLPPTIYVMFDSQDEYEVMKGIISEYDSIIMNFDDIDLGQDFDEQEKRVSRVIAFTNGMKYFTYFIIGVLCIVIVAFLLFAIKENFYNFYKQIEVEKLLGASYLQIKAPFFLKIVSILSSAFAIAFVTFDGIIKMFSESFTDIFEKSLIDYLSAIHFSYGQYFIIEFVVLVTLCLIISFVFLALLIRKV